MKCAIHVEQDAVSSCPDCGRGLCVECTNRFEFPICHSCNSKRGNNEIMGMGKKIILSIVCAVIALVFFLPLVKNESSINIFQKSIFIVIEMFACASIPWGWSALNKITPKVFLFMPLVGWIMYFVIKLCISACIGWIVMPLQLIKMFLRKRTIEKAIAS